VMLLVDLHLLQLLVVLLLLLWLLLQAWGMVIGVLARSALRPASQLSFPIALSIIALRVRSDKQVVRQWFSRPEAKNLRLPPAESIQDPCQSRWTHPARQLLHQVVLHDLFNKLLRIVGQQLWSHELNNRFGVWMQLNAHRCFEVEFLSFEIPRGVLKSKKVWLQHELLVEMQQTHLRHVAIEGLSVLAEWLVLLQNALWVHLPNGGPIVHEIRSQNYEVARLKCCHQKSVRLHRKKYVHIYQPTLKFSELAAGPDDALAYPTSATPDIFCCEL